MATATPMREVKIKSSLKLKDMVNPKTIAALDESVRRLDAGELWGIINDIVLRTNPETDKTFEGFSGAFRMIPSDASRPILRSGILFVPDFIREDQQWRSRIQMLKDAALKVEIRFGLKFIVERDSNPQGYTWVSTPLFEEVNEDPVAKMISSVAEEKRLTIEHKPEPDVAPAPAPVPLKTASRK